MRTLPRAIFVVFALLAFGVDVFALDLSLRHDAGTLLALSRPSQPFHSRSLQTIAIW